MKTKYCCWMLAFVAAIASLTFWRECSRRVVAEDNREYLLKRAAAAESRVEARLAVRGSLRHGRGQAAAAVTRPSALRADGGSSDTRANAGAPNFGEAAADRFPAQAVVEPKPGEYSLAALTRMFCRIPVSAAERSRPTARLLLQWTSF
jgi:hypothetical protein